MVQSFFRRGFVKRHPTVESAISGARRFHGHHVPGEDQRVDGLHVRIPGRNKKPRRSGVFCRSLGARYWRTPLNSMSTRRFFWRPSAVLLVATGWVSPLPIVVTFEAGMPLLTR